jgi:hypothetical protein
MESFYGNVHFLCLKKRCQWQIKIGIEINGKLPRGKYFLFLKLLKVGRQKGVLDLDSYSTYCGLDDA